MVVMDTGTLLLLLRPNVDAPLDRSTGKPVESVERRLNQLVKTLERAKTKIVIPTPALSELLVRAGTAGPALLQRITKQAVFRIVDFDTRAAVEVAMMTRSAIDSGDKRGGVPAPWTKVKYDRQIVAIAKVVRARAIYSDDEDIEKLGGVANINVISIAALPSPSEDAQGRLQLDPAQVGSDDKDLSDEEFDVLIAETRKEDERGPPKADDQG